MSESKYVTVGREELIRRLERCDVAMKKIAGRIDLYRGNREHHAQLGNELESITARVRLDTAELILKDIEKELEPETESAPIHWFRGEAMNHRIDPGHHKVTGDPKKVTCAECLGNIEKNHPEKVGHSNGCASTRGSGGDDCDCGWTR